MGYHENGTVIHNAIRIRGIVKVLWGKTEMRITRLLQGAVLAMAMSFSAAPGASAATVNTVVPDGSGAVITATSLANLSTNGISFSAFLPSPVPFLINGSAFGGSNTLTVSQPPTSPQYLFGTFLDGRSQDGIVELLYSLITVNPASGFGSLALVTLEEVGTTSFFDDNTISGLATRPTRDDVAVNITIRSVAPIPLPAGIILLLTGLGALGLARRRAAA
ncbi:MAG: VPLPA-CTERM sorting domain-containing protein [Roseovarius sp.]|jgi:hypothetical protein|uniref:VPLPA-CTERM sorting domain-containing protein n=1 Tax=Roseovarius sp. TaxID=1486281 RepID=UPI0032EAAE33